MSFPRYLKYKDSGVEWLGEVPEHWIVIKLGRAAFMQEGPGLRNWQFTDEGTRVICVTNITENGIDFSRLEKFISIDEFTSSYLHFTVQSGDILLSSSGNSWGKVAIYSGEEKVMLNTSTIRLNESASSPLARDFLAMVLQSDTVREQLGLAMTGSCQPNFGPTHLSCVLVTVPPREEQTLIAAFLDQEIAKIDELVVEQRRLIELLKEKRQAVISHAVTKGLNPKVPLRPSGIEWLGDIPEHWNAAAVRFRYTVQLGKMLDTEKITGKHLKPYLRVFDVQWGAINVEDLPQMDFDPSVRERFRLTPGDLLINEGGSYPGRSAIWNGELEECYFQKALHRLRPSDPTSDTTRFFFYIMAWATAFGVFTAGGNESTIEHLPAEKFRKYRFAFPPMSEQVAIADFLDRELCSLDALIAEAKRTIELLQERRTALISAAVTGKIDVQRLP